MWRGARDALISLLNLFTEPCKWASDTKLEIVHLLLLLCCYCFGVIPNDNVTVC